MVKVHKKLRTALLFTGFSLFVLSLLLPAVDLRVGQAHTVYGYACALIGLLFIPGIIAMIITTPSGFELSPLYVAILGLCNVVMMFAAVAIALGRAARLLRVVLPIAAILVCAGRFVLPTGDSSSMEFFAGYYVWALSFVLLAIGANYIGIHKEAQLHVDPERW